MQADVCPGQANRVLMGWRWNVVWHFHSILIPLLLVLQFKPYHLKNIQTKNVSLTAMKRVGLCAEVSMEEGVEAFKVMIHGEKCFMPQENDLSGSLLQKDQWWWSFGSGFYEAVDGIKTFITNAIKKFLMWYPNIIWHAVASSCLKPKYTLVSCDCSFSNNSRTNTST